jgi:YndJ-like protein
MNPGQPRLLIPLPVLLGLAVWFGTVLLSEPGWAGALSLLAPLVAVPLALTLLEAPREIRWAFALAASLLAPTYGWQRGVVAAGFTLPWLMLCLCHAFAELLRLPKRCDFVAVLMRGYLVVGAVWLLLARLGARPLGFEDVIVHATAVHFHYAGFVLPTLLLRLAHADRQRATRCSLVGVLAGMPLVAAGITLTVWQIHWLESAATLFMAASCWLAAWQQGRFACVVRRGLPRALLLASSASLAVAMVFACLYAGGRLLNALWLDIPFMLRFHGGLQVFGFALPGLVAWTIIDRDAGAQSPRVATCEPTAAGVN